MKRAGLGSMLLLLVLAGCGFHLRGSELSANFETVYVSSVSAITIEQQLARSLGFAGVEVITDRSAADVVIDLTSQREARRSISVTERARTAEYEISLEIGYRIVGQEPVADDEEPVETVLVEDRSVRVARTFRLDRNNIVGSSEEQALLRGEMEQDVVQQILRSLDTATRNQTNAAEAAPTPEAKEVTSRADPA
jgi:LPS-assembly lipoprotein